MVWCGGVVRTRCNAQVSDHLRARMQLIKWACASAPTLRLDSPAGKKPLACSLRRQVPGTPRAKPHPTPRRGKRLRGTPTSPPTPSEEGGRNLFHLLGVGCGDTVERYTWTCLPGKADPLTQITTCFSRKTRSNKLPLTTITNPG